MKKTAWLAILILHLAACATAPRHHWREAAREAAADAGTWAPLAGALAFSIGEADREASEWAVRHNPIFGSTSSASSASDALLTTLVVTALGTALLAPPNEEVEKPTRIAATALGIAGANGLTDPLKRLSGRQRPNGADARSLPSGHATTAFAAAGLASANLSQFDMSENTRWWLDAGLTTMAAGTAWARVEANKHYPVDVLVGAALGNFIAVFTAKAIGLDRHGLQVTASGDALLLTIQWTAP